MIVIGYFMTWVKPIRCPRWQFILSTTWSHRHHSHCWVFTSGSYLYIWMKLRQFEGRCEIPWAVLSLTHCGLVNQYGVIQLGQHWFSQCFNAWHLAITLTNVDWSSVTSCGIHLRAISLGTSNVYILDMSLKITYTKLHPHIPRVNDL